MWSPSSLNVLRICHLRSAYSTDKDFSSKFRRGNTYSSMGIASHKLSEKVWKNQFRDVDDSEIEAKISEEWASLIEEEFKRLTSVWFPAKVPLPRDWPYFALTQVRSVTRASSEVRRRLANGGNGSVGSVRIEQKIVDPENGLQGTPDRVVITNDGFYVLDLKTGHAVSEFSENYRRQLLIYAHLVSLTTSLPLLGIGLISAGGDTIWEDTDQSDVEQVIDDVKSEIASFTAEVQSGQIKAVPTPQNCRFCPYKPVCKQYWQDLSPEWSDYRGVVGRVVQISDEQTFTIEQILPSHSPGQLIGISNCSHVLQDADIVSVTDGRLRGQSLRGSWYTRVVKL